MGVSGHEEEFLQLFSQEADMRLTRLGEQLLRLESGGSDRDLIASIFREAHTLKGAAAVVGVNDAARVAHALEDILEEVRSGERAPSPALVDVALRAVDGLRSIIPRLLAGQNCSAEADELERDVREWAAAPAAAPEPEPVAVAAAPAAPKKERRSARRAGSPDAPSAATPVVGSPVVAPPRVPTPNEEAPASAPAARLASNDMVVLPVGRLDELVRLVGESAAANLRIGRMLSDRLGVDPATISEFRDLSRVLNDLQERTMRARMVPVSTITDQLHRAARDLARSLDKDVHWDVRGEDTELDRGVLQQLADPLMHLVRNAVDHGVESRAERAALGKPPAATVKLHAMQLGSEVIVTVSDDGRGVNLDAVRDQAARDGHDVSGLSDDEVLFLVFRSGLSTSKFISEVSGRGVGLDAVKASVEGIRGRIEVRSEPGHGCEFRLIVPITLAVLPCLLLTAAGNRYAVPMHSVMVSMPYEPEREEHTAGRSVVWVDGQAVPVSNLADTLGVGVDEPQHGAVVVLAGVTRRHAFRVDALLGQRDVVVKGLGRMLPRLPITAGASVEPDGSILLVLDSPGLIERARLSRVDGDRVAAMLAEDLAPRAVTTGSVLVVDDALTVRELQRSILERAGFEVRLAGDGVEAMALLAERPADLVLTDVEMPRMDGFKLTAAIRAQPGLTNVPVLILTSRSSEEDRQRGLEAGADGYIIKSAFDEAGLLTAVNRLLGRRP